MSYPSNELCCCTLRGQDALSPYSDSISFTVLSVLPAHAADKDFAKLTKPNEELYPVSRSNGSRWFSFGLGTIAACQSAAIIDESHSYKDGQRYELYVAERGDPGLELIKKWVAEKFGRALNFSPRDPKEFAETYVVSLVLYSSPKVPASVIKGPSNLNTDDENDDDTAKRLFAVPMIPILFGNDSAKVAATYKKLRAWLSPNNRAKNQLNPKIKP